LIDSRSPRGTSKVIEIARASDDVATRQYAIRFLGDMNDAASLDELIRIYDADKTREIRAQIIRALADREDAKARAKLFEIARQGDTPELRVEAIRRLGDHGRVSRGVVAALHERDGPANQTGTVASFR
jgi:HEAT repeat protein